MSVVFAFEEEFFAETIPGFKDSRKTYSSKSSKKKRESQLPKKVNSLKSLKSFANSFDNIYFYNNVIKVYDAIVESDRLADANLLLSKKDCSEPDLKKQVDSAHAANLYAVKKFLNDESSTLTLKFVQKRVTRKRSGMISKLILVFFNSNDFFLKSNNST